MSTHSFFKIAFSLLLLFCVSYSSAQPKVKFGNVSMEELQMTEYPADTSATAVILHEDRNVYYRTIKLPGDKGKNSVLPPKANFRQITQHRVRIKVLKESGINAGNVSLWYFRASTPVTDEIKRFETGAAGYIYEALNLEYWNDVAQTFLRKEWIRGLRGYVYNIENGEIVREKLTNSNIVFNEEEQGDYHKLSFTLPNVKAGSVIEYQFERSSPNVLWISDHFFQHSVPVVYSRLKVNIPDDMKFNAKTLGFDPINYTANNSYLYFDYDVQTCKTFTYECHDIPAMKDHAFLWNKNDYFTRATFNISSYHFPDVQPRYFARKWDDVLKQLYEDQHFGQQSVYTSTLRNALPDPIKPGMADEEKIAAILQVVRNNIEWTGVSKSKFTYMKVNDLERTLNTKKGSSAEMNMLLICYLQYKGYNAYPIVMSRRSEGRLMMEDANINALNYFIVGVETPDKKLYFMDAPSKYCGLNVLSPECLVLNALCIKKGEPYWVDLHNLGQNMQTDVVKAKFNDKGVLAGEKRTILEGVNHMLYNENLEKQGDKETYQKKLEEKLNLSIANLDIENNVDGDEETNERFAFEHHEIKLGDEYIRFNPLIFPTINENPFKEKKRTLPVEFPYPYTYSLTGTIEIPEGYVVAELPKAEEKTLAEDGFMYSYDVQQNGRQLRVYQHIKINETFYPANNYEKLQELWEQIADKSNTQVVLKKQG